jgi:putative PIN family toxin of toxin-antitoxin system
MADERNRGTQWPQNDLLITQLYDIVGNMMIVLDTSVMVAALRSPTGASAALLKAARHDKLGVLISVGMILEYEAVLKREEHLSVAGLTHADVDDLLDAFCIFARPVTNHFRWRPALTDPDDDLVLETAVNGGADAIVTFNMFDFQRAKTLFGIQVERPNEALRRIK